MGVIGFDGPIDLQSLRLCGLQETAPTVLNGTPLLPVSGQREFAAEAAWDLPSLASGATSLLDVTVTGARQGDLAQAALASSILAGMGELKLYGMKAAFDQIVTTAVKRQHEPQQVIGDFVGAEIAEKQA